MQQIKTLALLLILAMPLCLLGQSKKEITKHHINYKAEKEINYEDGIKEARILEESWYNEDGLLIEYKDWDKDGEPKVWEKYSYNADQTLKEKEEYSKKGEFKAKVIYHYKNGLLIKKSYFDKKLRLVKEKIYEYGFNQ